MQFIAEDPIHVVCSNETPPLYDTNQRMIKPGGRRTYAKFQRGTAPEFARRIGLDRFELRKMPEGVEPGQWLSYYDSVEAAEQLGWTADERKAIEEKLLETDGVVVVERPRLPAPWPNYDQIVAAKGGLSSKDVVDKIVGKVVEDGYAPAVVIAYELERERPRKSVIAALEELMPVGEASPASEDTDVFDEELIEA